MEIIVNSKHLSIHVKIELIDIYEQIENVIATHDMSGALLKINV